MRAKAAKSEKKRKAAASRGVGREGSAKGRPGKGLAGRVKVELGDGTPANGPGKGDLVGERSPVGASGRFWPLEAGSSGLARERNEVAPALPVPIASFTI